MYLVLHFTSRSFRLCHCAHVRYYRTWVRAYYCVGEEKKVKGNIEVCYSRLFCMGLRCFLHNRCVIRLFFVPSLSEKKHSPDE